MKEYMTAIHSMEEFQEAAAKGGQRFYIFCELVSGLPLY